MASTPPLLSIIIVNWNTRDLLYACLKSIPSGNPPTPYEVIVVDNGSTDGSASMVLQEFPEVYLLQNKSNEGFARGTNQGVSRSRGKYILLLNTDIVVLPDSIQKLCTFLDHHPPIGVVAPQLRYPDGRIQKSCRSFPRPFPLLFACLGLDQLFPKHPKLNEWKMGHWDHQDTRPVEQPMMSAFLVKRACWEEVGNLDEAFANYFNDVDWCYRLRQETSWQVYHVSQAAMIHHHGQSGRQLGYGRILQSSLGLCRFYEKHYIGSKPYPLYVICISAIGLTAIGRHVMETVQHLRSSSSPL